MLGFRSCWIRSGGDLLYFQRVQPEVFSFIYDAEEEDKEKDEEDEVDSEKEENS